MDPILIGCLITSFVLNLYLYVDNRRLQKSVLKMKDLSNDMEKQLIIINDHVDTINENNKHVETLAKEASEIMKKIDANKTAK